MTKEEFNASLNLVNLATNDFGYELSPWELAFMAKISVLSDLNRLPSQKQCIVLVQIIDTVSRYLDHYERLSQKERNI